MPRLRFLLLSMVFPALPFASGAAEIPLPEHPRPDFQRAQWMNLNGDWEFRFDAEHAGLEGNWAAESTTEFPEEIVVPFPWGSKLSGVEDQADIAWYRRNIAVPEAWKGKRVFVVVGASDWRTQGWLDGEPIGEHQGGYTPFEFELTDQVEWGEEQSLVLRVDDSPHAFKLEGKQGYGEAKGIWQTVYLEARGELFLDTVHFTPQVEQGSVQVRAALSGKAKTDGRLRLQFKADGVDDIEVDVPAGSAEVQFEAPVPNPRLWGLDDPFLYDVDVTLESEGQRDRVSSYFGMRTISVETLPGTDIPYVALNGEPIYLQMALDQSYHPDGFYTFPSDAFMRDEILRSKKIGLNANRVHIKLEIPRKLYWADKLGLLIMEDVPNSWGEPTPEARAETEFALRGMIERDYNHPSIFSWVVFNETWGLFTGEGEEREYLPETQEWVVSMYRLAKQLDPTRLVEDNSPVHGDHTETDLNTWHDYLPGYKWKERLEQIVADTYPGSEWNFIGEFVQGRQPLLNSESGNVWGYHGSAGDVDWTWDYHIMLNQFRRHRKIAGWLYTEHHDVINEWNGYYRYDRSEKVTGLESFVPGMSLQDLHAPFYLSTGSELCRDVAPGERVEVPVTASLFASALPADKLNIRWELYGWDTLGRRSTYDEDVAVFRAEPWMADPLKPLEVTMPAHPALTVLALSLETESGLVLHRNFTTFLVAEGESPRDAVAKGQRRTQRVVRFSPAAFSEASWSRKQWEVFDGLKVNGAGHGFFEYAVAWPEGLEVKDVAGASLVFEASAKQLFGKDIEGAIMDDGDYMRGQGSLDPSKNPNAYPMTDTETYPSQVFVRVNGAAAGAVYLPDDPADHRGVLSWRAQTRFRDIENDRYEDRKLHEAGSYGYLTSVTLPREGLEKAAASGELVIRFEVDSALPGGLALYGERFGRYPVDPAIVFDMK